MVAFGVISIFSLLICIVEFAPKALPMGLNYSYAYTIIILEKLLAWHI